VTSGVSLSWYGFIPAELPKNSSPATYSIDDQTPVNFLLKGLPANSPTTVYNQKFFETAQLTAGPHTLKAVFEGNNSTPLTLDYLVVQNGTLSTASVSSLVTSSTSGSGVSGTSATLRSSTPVGAIVGGVIGGLALIVFAIFGFLFLRRLHKRAAHKRASISISSPRSSGYTPLHLPSITQNPSLSADRSYSPTPQTTQMGTHATYGSMPSITNTELSQSIEPPSTSSGVTTHPSYLRPVPLKQTALTIANPSFSSLPSSVSTSVPSPPPSKVDREAEALAALGPQRRGNNPTPTLVQGNDTQSANVVLHADSGIRMPSSTSKSVLEIPPTYTPN
jgi:hypothetical protein